MNTLLNFYLLFKNTSTFYLRTFYLQEACITVAAVLHFLFLSSFCWMLCEGIMLYLLLVVVFSKLSKNVWFFLFIGYGKIILKCGAYVIPYYQQ